MPDFLLELRSEEIPARMQAGARAELERLFRREMEAAGVAVGDLTVYSTPRRLALVARGLPDATQAISEEAKGPPEGAPDAAIDGFCRKNGVTREQLTLREVKGRATWFAVIEKPGRAVRDLLAEAIPTIIRDFAWPKSMRWGAASISTESPRWVRPLSGIVAILGKELVECEAAGIPSGYATIGHRFHHPGAITIGGAHDYIEKLRACHVIVDHEERALLIREGARSVAAQAGLQLVEDEGLVVENAGLTEWPIPLLGFFDEDYLSVPFEVIQLTARVNQKYFVCTKPSPVVPAEQLRFQGRGRSAAGAEGVGKAVELPHSPTLSPKGEREIGLANTFICTANIEAADGGAAIVDGNRKVLAARLSDARFFWEQDRKKTLAQHAEGLARITFHEKLGTVADKAERVAKLARWLVEEGIVKSSPSLLGEGDRSPQASGGGAEGKSPPSAADASATSPSLRDREDRAELANLAHRAALLCKADLVTEMVGEFPELQGVMGGYYARAEGLPDAVADAIRDHYKPVGQGDEVPTAPVTVAVSLADKLDSLFSLYAVVEPPTGSKDPFAQRRSALGVLTTVELNQLRFSVAASFNQLFTYAIDLQLDKAAQLEKNNPKREGQPTFADFMEKRRCDGKTPLEILADFVAPEGGLDPQSARLIAKLRMTELAGAALQIAINYGVNSNKQTSVLTFLADRLKVQQREAGVRHDLIDAVFSLGNEDDLVRLLHRVNALQSYIETSDGQNLLAAYKRAANILKKEDWTASPSPLQGRGRSPAGAEGVGDVTLASADNPHPNPSPKGEELQSDIPRTGEEDPLALVDDPELKAVIDAKLRQQREASALSYTPEPAEKALIEALDSAEPKAQAAIAAEDFTAAMQALASLRAPIDAFFDNVTVNDPDGDKRAARLDLLARFRDAVGQVADFGRIEG